MNKIKKNQKGSIVLVILAILATAAVPTLLDFVDDLKSKGEVANARTAYVAAQTIATEQIALGKTDSEIIAAITNKKVCALTGITDYMDIVTTPPVVINGKVKKVTYVGATHTVVIENGKSAVVTKNS